MSRLIKAVMTVAMMASPGSIEAQTLPLDTQSYLLARAESLDLSERLVAFVAERAEPTQLGAQAFALETESSPRAVITRLCGNVSEAYIAAFRARNSATDLDLDAPLTAEQGTALLWPACVPRGQQFEGSLAAVNAELVPLDSVSAFATDLKDVMVEEGVTDQLDLSPSPPPGHLSGQIVTAIEDAQTSCGSEPANIFDAVRIRTAYRYSAPRLYLNPRPTRVWVVDNGIYGSDPGNHRRYGPAIPRSFFPPGDEVGPPIAGDIYPSNYRNQILPVTPVSGHGTHVAGLAIGGPTLMPDRSILIHGQYPWLTLWIINVGRGARDLIPNSQQSVIGTLTVAHGDIVNMSLSYVWPDQESLQRGLRRMIQERSHALFVVAAGNRTLSDGQQGGVDVANAGIYPAALGGVGGSAPNLITVGAHDQQGRLALFSNFGRQVDLLAPGCNVASWLADGSEPVLLSGTSQAAPIVSFAASLILSLDNAIDPYGVKARLFASGDLLDPDQWDLVASRSRLNIPRALFLFDDYVRTSDGTEYLGRVRGVSGLRCPDNPAQASFYNMLGFNRWPGGARPVSLYLGRTQGLYACSAEIMSGAAIQFRATHQLDQDGTPQPLTEELPPIAFDQIEQVVLRSSAPQSPPE